MAVIRNLQEQVYKNMQDIASMQEGTYVLAQFGLKVIAEVDPLSSLPASGEEGEICVLKSGTVYTVYVYNGTEWDDDVSTYKEYYEEWGYGDCIAVDVTTTLTQHYMLALTRANGSHDNDYWFDIGTFPMPGPQGPQGETGPQGEKGDTGATGVGVSSFEVEYVSSTTTYNTYRWTMLMTDGTTKTGTFNIPISGGGGTPTQYVKSASKVGEVLTIVNVNAGVESTVTLDLSTKQDTLTAGTNIAINNNVISVSKTIETINAGDALEKVEDSSNVYSLNVLRDESTITLDGSYRLKVKDNVFQPKIDASHKVSADNVDDSTTTNKFVTASDKVNWDGKQNAITSSNPLSSILVEVQDVFGTTVNAKTAFSNLKTSVDSKSTVSVSSTGTATDEIQYITVNGTEKKIAGGGSAIPVVRF